MEVLPLLPDSKRIGILAVQVHDFIPQPSLLYRLFEIGQGGEEDVVITTVRRWEFFPSVNHQSTHLHTFPPKKPKPKRKKGRKEKKGCSNSLEMHGDHDIGPDQPDQLDALPRVHRHHEQRHGWPRDRGPAQVDEHEVDARVAFGDLGQLGHQEGVARDVDCEGSVEGGG